MENQERIDYFRTEFANKNPPPSAGLIPIKPDSVIATEDNRWPCVGGPMDGLGIAKSIALKKGAGRKKLHIVFRPSSVVEIHSEDETVKGHYVFVDSEYVWMDEAPQVLTTPDIWDNEYWVRDKERKR